MNAVGRGVGGFARNGYYFVAIIFDGARYVVQRLSSLQTDPRCFANGHTLNQQLGLHERHGADFVRDIQKVVFVYMVGFGQDLFSSVAQWFELFDDTS